MKHSESSRLILMIRRRKKKKICNHHFSYFRSIKNRTRQACSMPWTPVLIRIIIYRFVCSSSHTLFDYFNGWCLIFCAQIKRPTRELLSHFSLTRASFIFITMKHRLSLTFYFILTFSHILFCKILNLLRKKEKKTKKKKKIHSFSWPSLWENISTNRNISFR